MSCDCSTEEEDLKVIVSRLTIKFLIYYDSDGKYIFPDWDILYCIVQDDSQEKDDNHHESSKYPFDIDR